LLDAIELLNQRDEDVLEDVGGEVIVQARATRNGIDQPLVASDQRLPGGSIAPPAGQHQRLIARPGRIPQLQATFRLATRSGRDSDRVAASLRDRPLPIQARRVAFLLCYVGGRPDGLPTGRAGQDAGRSGGISSGRCISRPRTRSVRSAGA
jgi:hypothetical protein